MTIVCQSYKGLGQKKPNTFGITVILQVNASFIWFSFVLTSQWKWNWMFQFSFLWIDATTSTTNRSSDTNHKYKFREHRTWALCQNTSHITKCLGGNINERATQTNQIRSAMRWWHSFKVNKILLCIAQLNVIELPFNWNQYEKILTFHLIKYKTSYLAIDYVLHVRSVSTLLGYLKRFDANADIYLGERYGFQLFSPNGFNYITAGGGIVFSLSVIEKLVQICRCPSPASPDDMVIALCLQRIGIEPIHSSRFHQVMFCNGIFFSSSTAWFHSHTIETMTHYVLSFFEFLCIWMTQARPIDYPEEVLLYNNPISFHKFWQIDPYYVYEYWLRRNDAAAIAERRKYRAGFNADSYCSKNQNEFCHWQTHNENDWNEIRGWERMKNLMELKYNTVTLYTHFAMFPWTPFLIQL